MTERVRAILHELGPENWQTKRMLLFEAIVEEGLDPVEADGVLREAAKRLGAPLEAVRRAWQDYLGPAPKEENAASVAVRLALEQGEFWHTPDGEAWATLPQDGHVEHHPLRGRGFKAWLSGLYYRAQGKPLYAQALADALAVLEAKALFEGAQHAAHPRVAEHEGRVYLDLGREDWKAVEVGPEGWRVVESRDCPVRFRRGRYMRPLPLPEPAGPEALEELRDLLALREERDWALVLGWLVGALNPRGPYPVLALTGEKGAGKSTAALVLKSVLDPQEGGLRAEPRDVEALMVGARGSWVLALDNLSSVPTWLSDALCRLSTGGGLGKRELYTDGEEFVLEAKRPVVLTGIALGALRDDLADRTALIGLTRLGDEERRPERELWAAFTRLHSRVLGALLTAASTALRRWEEARAGLSSLPRLADWAIWAEAAAPALGLEAGAVVRAFYEVQAALEQDLLEADPVAQAILLLTRDWPEGHSAVFSASDLLTELERVMGLEEAKRKPERWPRTSQGLGKHLPRLQAALRGAGVLLKGERDARVKRFLWRLEKVTEQYPQYPQTPQTGSSTAFSSAGIGAGIGAPIPAIPAQYPQAESGSRTALAGNAGNAGIDSPPLSKRPGGGAPPPEAEVEVEVELFGAGVEEGRTPRKRRWEGWIEL